MSQPSIEESGTHDTTRVDDVRIASVRPLLTPAVLLEDLPAPPDVEALVQVTRAAIGRVLHGRPHLLGYRPRLPHPRARHEPERAGPRVPGRDPGPHHGRPPEAGTPSPLILKRQP